jgi:aspartyl-tRNA(Asn)/glutamyl-tRNA(Gln) amidotransferase subunit C
MLTEDEVRHVAMLARLGLSDEEVEAMRVQLLDVLDYIAILQQVDTSTMPATAQVITHLNVTREDVPRPSWPVPEILANAPAREGDFFKVPPVLEDAREDDMVENESAASEVAGDDMGEEEIG